MKQVYYPKFRDYKWTSSTFQIHPDHFPSKLRGMTAVRFYA